MDQKFKWYVLGLAVLILAVYGRTLFFSFTNWDDEKQIVRNDEVTAAISLENTQHIFSTDYFVQSMYQPLATSSFNVEHKLFGMNAGGFHGMNLLWHLINTALVFWLFQLLLGKRYFSLFAAAIFALHPLSVEVVAWVSARSTLMYSSFFLGSMIAYILYIKRRLRWIYLIVSFLLFGIACFAKAMAVTLPAVLLALDYLLRRKWSIRWLVEKIPFGMVSLFFIWVALQGRSEFVTRAVDNSNFSTWQAVFFIPFQLMWYFVKYLVPANLSIIYRDPSSLNLFHYLAPLVIGSLVYLFIKKYRSHREVVFGALLFLIPVLPVLKLTPIGFSMTADRYMYLSGLGLLFIVGYFFTRMKFRRPESVKPFLFIAGLFVVLFSLQSFRRVSVWENSQTLWANVEGNFANKWLNSGLDKKKAASKIENEEGIKAARDMYLAAIEDFDKAISVYSRYWKAYYNRGNCKIRLQDYKGAMQDYNQGVLSVEEDDRKNPRMTKDLAKLFYARGYFNYTRFKDYDQALADFEEALILDPNHANAKKYKNRLLERIGR